MQNSYLSSQLCHSKLDFPKSMEYCHFGPETSSPKLCIIGYLMAFPACAPWMPIAFYSLQGQQLNVSPDTLPSVPWEEILPRLIITALTMNLPDTSYIKRTYKYPLIFDIYPLLLNVTFYLYLKYVFLLFSCNFLHNLQIFKMRFKKKLWIKNFSHTWLLSNQHYKNEVIRMKG